MQLADPLSFIDKLEQEQYLFVHHTSGDESPEDQEALHQTLRGAFGKALDRIASQWGEPDFLGGWDHPDFPDWYEAIMLASWNRPEGLVYLAYQWSGPEVPMLITFGRR